MGVNLGRCYTSVGAGQLALTRKFNKTKQKGKVMKTNDIKKGMKVRTKQLGTPVTGIMMDNMRGDTRLVDVKGSEIGMFDEMGSVYSHDIVQVEVDGEWKDV